MKIKVLYLVTILTLSLSNSLSWAQVVAAGSSYKSDIDELLTITRITLLPISDNVNGIYSVPLEKKLKEILENNHRWNFISSNLAGNVPSTRELESDEGNVKKLGEGLGVDAFLICKITKGPRGISLQMSLFNSKDGKILLQETIKEFTRFEIQSVLEQGTNLLNKILSKLPYDGKILSRNDLRVTINLGKRDGVDKDKVLSVIQIIKATRHPKFNFLISTEKEIIGKIKIYKADDTISFGGIISEKEKGVVQKNSKISGLNPVSYSAADALNENASEQELLEDKPDSLIAFGANPELWQPRKPPSLGQVGFSAGLGQFAGRMNPAVIGPIEATSSLFAGIGIMGELWLNEEWITRAQIRQSVFSTSNPVGGSSPDKLSVTLTSYELIVGYNFLLEEDFFSSKIELRGGFGNFSFLIDNSSPLGLTSISYYGPMVGVKGQFPVTKDRRWYAGAELNLYFNPAINEKPVSSGTGDTNNISDYSFFASKMVTSHLYLDGSINISMYKTQFSGISPDRATNYVTDASYKNTFFNFGFRYLF